MRTSLCELLGIEVPIILAPILAPVGAPAGPLLAAAVSYAGGLCTIALWLAEIDVLRARIRQMKSLTAKPFAVNLRLNLEPAARLDACLSEGVRIVPMFWVDPSKLAPRAKAGGALVMPDGLLGRRGTRRPSVLLLMYGGSGPTADGQLLAINKVTADV